MGTNFYLNVKNLDHENADTHIGKRSAAGLYCWDCGVTLCKGGEEAIHYGCRTSGHSNPFCNCGWYDVCPKCGKSKVDEDFSNSSGGRELGFNKSEPSEKTGVASCASFTWGIPEEKVIEFCKGVTSVKPIIDEYNREFTYEEFFKMLKECPVRYFNLVGQSFS